MPRPIGQLETHPSSCPPPPFTPSAPRAGTIRPPDRRGWATPSTPSIRLGRDRPSCSMDGPLGHGEGEGGQTCSRASVPNRYAMHTTYAMPGEPGSPPRGPRGACHAEHALRYGASADAAPPPSPSRNIRDVGPLGRGAMSPTPLSLRAREPRDPWAARLFRLLFISDISFVALHDGVAALQLTNYLDLLRGAVVVGSRCRFA